MKIYVAGASAERALIGHFINKLRALGCQVTFDWVAPIEADGGVCNEGLADVRRLELAQAALDGVHEADVFWLIMPRSHSIGAWVELGAALTWRRMRMLATDGTSGLPHILVSGPAPDRTIFNALVTVHETHVEAYEDIVRMVQR